MVQLNDGQLKSVRKALMQEFSADNTEVPIGKVKLLDIVTSADLLVEDSESQIVTDTTGGAAKSWISDKDIARRTFRAVVKKRLEVL